MNGSKMGFLWRQELFLDQLVAMGSVIAFSFIVTYVIAKVLDATIGLRVSEEDEEAGLDQSQPRRPLTAYKVNLNNHLFGGG